MSEIARRTVAAGTWNCPTLVLVQRLSVGNDMGRLSQVAGIRYMPKPVANAWLAAGEPVTPDHDRVMQKVTAKRRASFARCINRARVC